MLDDAPQKQLSRVGGEVKRLDSVEFKHLNALGIVGIFPNYASA